MAAQNHLSDIELAAFAEGGLGPDQRRNVAAHLDGCEACRADLVATLRLAEETGAEPKHPRPTWHRTAIGIGVALAAGLAAIVVVRQVREPNSVTVVRAPAAPTDRSRRVAAIAPQEGVVAESTDLRFTWHAHNADSYRFTLMLNDGTPAWTIETSDTSLLLPPQVTLDRGRTYFWRVDAMADGITASTGVLRLELPR